MKKIKLILAYIALLPPITMLMTYELLIRLFSWGHSLLDIMDYCIKQKFNKKECIKKNNKNT